ncbi:MAG: lysine 2,3-aminomutase, partial [Deltaproteobacteria bacterium]|nr:lysine 2,3-aminomutase [Deltaproteobacteria bacterium]
MEDWKRLLQQSITHPAQLQDYFGIATAPLNRVTELYPMRINPYYLGLIRKQGDPFWRQAVPDPMEIKDTVCQEDPLNEENLSPVPNLVHKY